MSRPGPEWTRKAQLREAARAALDFGAKPLLGPLRAGACRVLCRGRTDEHYTEGLSICTKALSAKRFPANFSLWKLD